MKKIGLLLLCFVMCSLFSWGQNTDHINFDEIKIETSKEDSPFYYEKLYQRYLDQDTTFTDKELSSLYYGNVFYSADDMPDYLETLSIIKSILQNLQPEYDSLQLSTLQNLSMELKENKVISLQKHIVLLGLTVHINQVSGLDNYHNTSFDSYMTDKICEQIWDSGDGRTERTALCVQDANEAKSFCIIKELNILRLEGKDHIAYITIEDTEEEGGLVVPFSCYNNKELSYLNRLKPSVNYDDVAEKVADKDSPYYYPELLKKYNKNYEELTEEDYYYLYYGLVFQEFYKPYDFFENEEYDRIVNSETATKKDLKKLNKIFNKALKKYPLRLNLIYRKMAVCAGLYGKDSEEASEYGMKYYSFIQMLLKNSGASIREAVYVNCLADQADVLDFLGFELENSEHLPDTSIDEFKVTDKDYSFYFYFDVTPCLKWIDSNENKDQF